MKSKKCENLISKEIRIRTCFTLTIDCYAFSWAYSQVPSQWLVFIELFDSQMTARIWLGSVQTFRADGKRMATSVFKFWNLWFVTIAIFDARIVGFY